MNRNLKKWGWAPVLAILSSTSMLFLYQNCGKAGFEGGEISDPSLGVQDVDPRLKGLPFPFKVSVNQIAFTSCPINTQNTTSNSALFTWKVGAFDNNPQASVLSPAGLQLNADFIAAARSVASTYSPEVQQAKVKEALMLLPSISNTQLQLSFRNPNRTRTDLAQLPTFSTDISFSPTQLFMSPTSGNAVAEAFKTLPAGPLNYFQNAENYADRPLEGTLNFNSRLGNYQDLLYTTYSSNYLTVGFMKTDGTAVDGGLQGPASSDPRYAYGSSYRPNFGRTNPAFSANGVGVQVPIVDSLDTIYEVDPVTGANVQAGWDCSYKFKIVQAADAKTQIYRGVNQFSLVNSVNAQGQTVRVCPGATIRASVAAPVCIINGIAEGSFGRYASDFGLGGACPANGSRSLVTDPVPVICQERYAEACPTEPYQVLSGRALTQVPPYRYADGVYGGDPEKPRVLAALRRFLPADKWEVNVSQKCVVPKNDTGACYAQTPVYDETFFPGAGNAIARLGMYEGCGVNNQLPCAAYLTLCLRR